MKTKIKKALMVASVPVFAFLGGFVAQYANVKTFEVLPAEAASKSAPLFFYGPDGKVRLQMGTYEGYGEAGLPLVGLSDNAGRLRMLFRLAGDEGSPVIIMKDRMGRDRMVMGLELHGTTDNPYINIIGADGRKKDLLERF